jgi:hypothetical protein
MRDILWADERQMVLTTGALLVSGERAPTTITKRARDRRQTNSTHDRKKRKRAVATRLDRRRSHWGGLLLLNAPQAALLRHTTLAIEDRHIRTQRPIYLAASIKYRLAVPPRLGATANHVKGQRRTVDEVWDMSSNFC